MKLLEGSVWRPSVLAVRLEFPRKAIMTRLLTLAAAVVPLTCLAGGCSTTTHGSASANSAPAAGAAEHLTRDTPKSTTEGNAFIAPADWTVSSQGPATILQPPESGSAIALVDVRAPGADSAVAAAWRAYKPDAAWPLKVVNQKPDKDGWTDRAAYTYQTSPNEKRDVGVDVQRAGGVWTIAIYDMGQAAGEKRLAQVALIYGELLPKGYTRESFAGFPFHPVDRKTMSVPEDERQAILDGLWEEGGFKFLWGGFVDLTRDPEANEIASEYIRDKIRETVKDPEIAELLCPKGYPYGAKRPPIDTDYYETFNRDNVHLVDLNETPIEAITPTGLRTDTAEYEFDALVFATGFDAMTGALLRMDIRGAEGVALSEVWSDGPRTYLGLQIAGFPNLFTITGPGSPSVLMNMPVAIEHHVDWIADCLGYLRDHGWTRIEATEEAQEAWAEHVAELGEASLYVRANSWYVGANIPGKPRVIMPYTGGQPMYRERCEAVRDAGYEGFVLDGA